MDEALALLGNKEELARIEKNAAALSLPDAAKTIVDEAYKLLENKCKEYKKEKTYEKLDIYNENRIKTVKESHTFRDIYIINKEIPIETIKFNDGEVVDAKYVTIEELNQMIDSGKAFEWLRWFIEEFYKITKE